jgi:hypothetical protein
MAIAGENDIHRTIVNPYFDHDLDLRGCDAGGVLDAG